MPIGLPRHTTEIGCLVTAGTAHGGKPGAVRAALHRLMQAGEIALVRMIARRMAIEAARVKQ
jgi:DNA-binding transcriptional regulator PaaX